MRRLAAGLSEPDPSKEASILHVRRFANQTQHESFNGARCRSCQYIAPVFADTVEFSEDASVSVSSCLSFGLSGELLKG